MPRKVSLPGASELFRATEPTVPEAVPVGGAAAATPPTAPAPAPRSAGATSATGRVRHDEKITVYVSGAELLAVEQLRLRLRAEFQISADRGRIVREALAAALADVDANGADAELLRRLAQR